MADMIPLKYNATGIKTGTLGQYDTGDSVPVIHGGLGKISIAANKILYSSAANVYTETDITSTSRSFLALGSVGAMQNFLNLVPGTGSGQVVTTSSSGTLPVLDGRNLKNVLPQGIIMMWSGTIASIPANFKLCDGANGTPDLRDKFIVGAGLGYVPGATGGSTTHTHVVTVQNTTLTINQMPSHKHTPAQILSMDGTKQAVNYGGGSRTLYMTGQDGSDATGGDQAHNHGATSGNSSNLPPYYALAYIMSVII